MPAAMMFVATLMFWLGRKKFVIVPPAGKAWFKDVFSAEGGKLVLNLIVIYFFVACFWMLWDQSNGNTWTLQAQSSLVDKNLGFGIVLLPAQIQFVNALFILLNGRARVLTDYGINHLQEPYTPLRLDAAVRTSDGRVVMRRGEPHIATPLPPETGGRNATSSPSATAVVIRA